MKISSEYDSYAYFRVTSELPLSEIIKQFGVAGEESSWSVGDRRKHAPTTQYEFSSWKMNSGLEVGSSLDNHLKALWEKMEIIRSAVSERPSEMIGVIQCVGRFKSHRDALVISAGHFSTAAHFQLSIDCDFYFEDDGEAKPCWDWN